MAESTIYRNEFFEGSDLNQTFTEHPLLSSIPQRQMWENYAKFYFLPFLVNCYRFTKQHKLPHFTLMCSPTFIFHRDRLHLRNFMSTIHDSFFKTMEMCGLLDETIMLVVEKSFHIADPIAGGTQQLYNMLWDYDLSPDTSDCKIQFSPESSETFNPNPGMTGSDLWLSRKTLWLQDDLNFLCTKYTLDGEYESQEVLDLSNVPEEKQSLYKPRTFYFKTFNPIPAESDESELISSDSELDSTIDDFDFDSSQTGLIDSTLDIEKDDEEMNRIIAFFANMPKVTGLIQGMLDMMTSLTRVLPLVAQKMDDSAEDTKLKSALSKIVDTLNKGVEKVLKICRFLGIKAEKKQSGAIALIVKDRFKKNRKDFLEYELDELNKTLDELNNVDQSDSSSEEQTNPATPPSVEPPPPPIPPVGENGVK